MPIQTPRRIREISPDLFEDENLAKCSFAARWLFAGLPTMADREGRLADRPKLIHGRLLPNDDGADADALLGELMERGFIHRYEIAGQRVIEIQRWRELQKPDDRQDAIYPDRDGNVPPNEEKDNPTKGKQPRRQSPTVGYEGLPA